MKTSLLPLLVWAAAANAAPTASPATIADNAALAATLNWDDRLDFDFASRGLVAGPAAPQIRDKAGAVLHDFAEDAQFSGPAPATVNPSLWRNATLLAKAGLFKVADGIWQVRGHDLSNMTVIAGKTGWILVDPLTTTEAAAAALALVNAKLGTRPVIAVIYTHSHADHFGGAGGVITAADAAAGKVAVIAPQGFMEHAVSENVIAGPAMLRRAEYMFGALLPRSATGHVSAGLGPARTAGVISLIAPNDSIRATGDTRTIDGVRFEFQMTPNTEAPAEMNFHLPGLRALCMAENANGAMHNLLTPRGALVRDAHGWSNYLLEARRRYAGKSDVVFTSHFWPRWGADEVSRYLLLHAQAYAFVHNESVRLMNNGLNAVEIGEAIKLPAPLARAWYNRPNYGSLKFNARAVYQRYLGAFDGDPVNLDPLPRNDVAVRYVAAMGGSAKVMQLAATAAATGDDRWAATLLGHVVRADPGDAGAREALAKRYEQLAYRSEAAPWRDFYLSGALELRDGPKTTATVNGNGIAANLQVAQLLDTMSVRVKPEAASGAPFTVAFVIPDMKERHLVTIANGVMLHEIGVADAADATLTVSRLALIGMVGGQVMAMDLMDQGKLQIDGDPLVLQRFLTLFQPPRPVFPLVTP
ncbi:alkyl/aryl-sulfatase [Sandarakinorhabdus sp. DWP1-3-1]|uniref:alkyl/aryl-sulfatase n=1 Tax=Sandarakinorhabdus sp. DWP1-3-1 TaxID=2804627 RepID=UPI003CEB0FBF